MMAYNSGSEISAIEGAEIGKKFGVAAFCEIKTLPQTYIFIHIYNSNVES